MQNNKASARRNSYSQNSYSNTVNTMRDNGTVKIEYGIIGHPNGKSFWVHVNEKLYKFNNIEAARQFRADYPKESLKTGITRKQMADDLGISLHQIIYRNRKKRLNRCR